MDRYKEIILKDEIIQNAVEKNLDIPWSTTIENGFNESAIWLVPTLLVLLQFFLKLFVRIFINIFFPSPLSSTVNLDQADVVLSIFVFKTCRYEIATIGNFYNFKCFISSWFREIL